MRKMLFEKFASHIRKGPLTDLEILVVAFVYYISGPVAAQQLADQGALVIKIERQPGDPSRQTFSSALFNTLSHNQLSVGIDLSNSEDIEFLKDLLKNATVILDNRSAYAKQNDFLLNSHFYNKKNDQGQVYCSISGYPNPNNHIHGVDAPVQAETGVAFANCFNPEMPLKVGLPFVDFSTGLFAANHILANLCLVLSSTEKDIIRIEASLAGVCVYLMASPLLAALEGREFLRTGNQDPDAVPFGFYRAKNGLLSIAVVNETQFKNLCINVLQDKSFLEKYPTLEIRRQNQNQFDEDFNNILGHQDREHWVKCCREYKIPAGSVLRPSEALKLDFIQNLITQTIDGNSMITAGVTNSHFTEDSKPIPAPTFNQHGSTLFSLWKSISENRDNRMSENVTNQSNSNRAANC